MMNSPKLMAGVRLGMLLLKATRDPEGAMLDLIDDFDKSSNKDELMNRFAQFLMKRYKGDGVNIKISEDGLELILEGVDDIVEELHTDISRLVNEGYKFVPEGKVINGLMDAITITYEENRHICTIKISVYNEKVLQRLNEIFM